MHWKTITGYDRIVVPKSRNSFSPKENYERCFVANESGTENKLILDILRPLFRRSFSGYIFFENIGVKPLCISYTVWFQATGKTYPVSQQTWAMKIKAWVDKRKVLRLFCFQARAELVKPHAISMLTCPTTTLPPYSAADHISSSTLRFSYIASILDLHFSIGALSSPMEKYNRDLESF